MHSRKQVQIGANFPRTGVQLPCEPKRDSKFLNSFGHKLIHLGKGGWVEPFSFFDFSQGIIVEHNGRITMFYLVIDGKNSIIDLYRMRQASRKHPETLHYLIAVSLSEAARNFSPDSTARSSAHWGDDQEHGDAVW